MSARHQSLLNLLGTLETVTYATLAKELKVSAMTVRRDVDTLAEQGAVIKTLRGCRRAQSEEVLLRESALSERIQEAQTEKQAIAGLAVQLAMQRGVIYLDGGTTCLALAECISAKCRGLTLVTCSAMIGMKLGVNEANTTIVVGGQYEPHSATFVGPLAEEIAARYRVETAFFSTQGLVVNEGTWESVMSTWRLKQVVAAQAGEVVLLIDHRKFGRRGLGLVLPVTKIQQVITDDQAPKADLAALRAAGINVQCADRKTDSKSAGRGL